MWHGANWTFVAWGALHGFYLVFAIWTEGPRARIAEAVGLARHPSLHNAVRLVVTMSLVLFAWIFFRANSIEEAFYIAGHLFRGLSLSGDIYLGLGAYGFGIAVLAIAFLELVQMAQRRAPLIASLEERPMLVRWAVYYAGIACILVFGEFGGQEFVYFQF